MLLFRTRHVVIVSLLVLLLSTKIVMCESSSTNSDIQRLLETAVRRANSGRAGFKLLQFSVRYPEQPEFSPINGLDQPNAVPFLIDVVRNGSGLNGVEIFQDQGSIFFHIARCYAALCLGVSRDERAFEPLLEALIEPETVEANIADSRDEKRKHLLSDYAALGLGYLGDINAAEPIVRVLPTRGQQYDCFAVALMLLHDIRAVRPLIQHASNEGNMSYRVHSCLQNLCNTGFAVKYISKVYSYRIPDFPELGELNASQVYLSLWKHLEIQGPEFAKRQFNSNYPRWKRLKQERPNDYLSQRRLLDEMMRSGVFVLPHLMEQIEKGDDSLIPATLRFRTKHGNRRDDRTNRVRLTLHESVSRSDCIEWWQVNRAKFMLELQKK